MRFSSKSRSGVALTAGLVVLFGGWLMSPLWAQTPPEMQRISFQIATGPLSGSYLQVGEGIAVAISHPPGLPRCDVVAVCGPEGLIATTRSSSGSQSNIYSVDRGNVQSALVQGDIAAAAFAGSGPFKDGGALKDLRVIARLHDDALHFVVAPRSRIKRLKDIVGKRVAVDSMNSATEYAVRNVLAAAGLSTARVRLRMISAERAAEDLRDGKLDAYFVIGVAPIASVDGVVRRGYGKLIGLEPRVLANLTRKTPMYGKIALVGGTYRSSKTVNTLGIASLWVVHRSQSKDTVYKILRSLWNPVNQADLRRRGNFAKTLDLRKASENLPLPLHEGAQRFYAAASR